jgi:type IV pilus assembly protein PilW
MKRTASDQHGFTLVEMMIAIAIFSIVMTSVYGVYRAQMRTHYVQQQVVDMQQNIRAAMYLMEREIKLAGLNPAGAAGVGVSSADSHILEFNLDNSGGYNDGIDNDGSDGIDEGDNNLDDNGNGFFDEADEAEWYDGDTNDAGEEVKYRLSNDDDENGINDGLAGQADGDGGSCDLQRWDSASGTYKTLAMNIDALDFAYLKEDGSLADENGDGIPEDLSDIRTVQVALVARSSAAPSDFFSDHTDAQSYQNQQGAVILPAQNDSFRRMLMTMEVTCRNIGL